MLSLYKENLEATTKLVRVFIFHKSCGSTREDIYLANMALALFLTGHQIVLLTCYIEKDSIIFKFWKERHMSFECHILGKWAPKSLCGYFKTFFTMTYLSWGVLLVLFQSLSFNRSNICISDIDSRLLPLLRVARNSIIYIRHFPELEKVDKFYNNIRLVTTLGDAMALKYADHIIVESKRLQVLFRKSYPNVHIPVAVINYFDHEWCLSESYKFQSGFLFPAKTAVFLSLGEFKRYANIYFLLDALNIISEQFPKFKIKIIFANIHEKLSTRDERYFEEVENYANTLHFRENITFIKTTTRLDQEVLIRQCSGIVHPAAGHYYPGPLLMGMSLKKPIIAQNKGYAADILTNNQTAMLTEDNVQVFAKKMVTIANYPAIGHYLSENAFMEFTSRFSFSSFSEKINALVSKYT